MSKVPQVSLPIRQGNSPKEAREYIENQAKLQEDDVDGQVKNNSSSQEIKMKIKESQSIENKQLVDLLQIDANQEMLMKSQAEKMINSVNESIHVAESRVKNIGEGLCEYKRKSQQQYQCSGPESKKLGLRSSNVEIEESKVKDDQKQCDEEQDKFSDIVLNQLNIGKKTPQNQALFKKEREGAAQPPKLVNGRKLSHHDVSFGIQLRKGIGPVSSKDKSLNLNQIEEEFHVEQVKKESSDLLIESNDQMSLSNDQKESDDDAINYITEEMEELPQHIRLRHQHRKTSGQCSMSKINLPKSQLIKMNNSVLNINDEQIEEIIVERVLSDREQQFDHIDECARNIEVRQRSFYKNLERASQPRFKCLQEVVDFLKEKTTNEDLLLFIDDYENYKQIRQRLKVPKGQVLQAQHMTMLRESSCCEEARIQSDNEVEQPNRQIFNSDIQASRKREQFEIGRGQGRTSKQLERQAVQRSRISRQDRQQKSDKVNGNKNSASSWNMYQLDSRSERHKSMTLTNRPEKLQIFNIAKNNSTNPVIPEMNSNIASNITIQNMHPDTDVTNQQLIEHRCREINQHHLQIHMNCYKQMINLNFKMNSYLKQSTSKSKMITNLIEDLLDLAKMENSVFKLNNDYFNLIEVITEAFNIVSFSAEEKNIKLLLEVDRSKPFIFQKVYSDKRRFLQILLNFISNSLKFIKKQDGYLKIHLKAVEEQITENQIFPSKRQKQINLARTPYAKIGEQNANDEQIPRKRRLQSMEPIKRQNEFDERAFKEVHKYIQIQLVVEDNGTGISKEGQAKLFMDYNKLQENEKSNAQGTGLGLSICKKIIESMGGRIKVNSAGKDQGTSFIITLQTKAIDKKVYCHNRKEFDDMQKYTYFQELGLTGLCPEFHQKYSLEEIRDLETIPLNSDDKSHIYHPIQTNSSEVILNSKLEVYRFNTITLQQDLSIKLNSKSNNIFQNFDKVFNSQEIQNLQHRNQQTYRSASANIQAECHQSIPSSLNRDVLAHSSHQIHQSNLRVSAGSQRMRVHGSEKSLIDQYDRHLLREQVRRNSARHLFQQKEKPSFLEIFNLNRFKQQSSRMMNQSKQDWSKENSKSNQKKKSPTTRAAESPAHAHIKQRQEMCEYQQSAEEEQKGEMLAAGDDAGEILQLPVAKRSQQRIEDVSFKRPLETKIDNLEHFRDNDGQTFGSSNHSDISGSENDSPSQIEGGAKTSNVANHAMLSIVPNQNHRGHRHQTIPEDIRINGPTIQSVEHQEAAAGPKNAQEHNKESNIDQNSLKEIQEQSESSKEEQVSMIDQLIGLIKKHKQRKLRILIANDDSFALFVISSGLQILSIVDIIDTAENGQEAYDKVRENEHAEQERFYDLIFLDLGMPLKDGFEACKMIKNHYEEIRNDQDIKSMGCAEEPDECSSDKEQWLQDLNLVYVACLKSLQNEEENKDNQRSGSMNGPSSLISSLIQSENSEEPSEPKESEILLNIFKRLYCKVKYRVLNRQRQPFIFAYSGYIDKSIISKTQQVGFDGCFELLTQELTEQLIHQYIDNLVEKYIMSHLTDINKWEQLNAIIIDRNMIRHQEDDQITFEEEKMPPDMLVDGSGHLYQQPMANGHSYLENYGWNPTIPEEQSEYYSNSVSISKQALQNNVLLKGQNMHVSHSSKAANSGRHEHQYGQQNFSYEISQEDDELFVGSGYEEQSSRLESSSRRQSGGAGQQQSQNYQSSNSGRMMVESSGEVAAEHEDSPKGQMHSSSRYELEEDVKVASEDGALFHASSCSQGDSQGAPRACAPSGGKNAGQMQPQIVSIASLSASEALIASSDVQNPPKHAPHKHQSSNKS